MYPKENVSRKKIILQLSSRKHRGLTVRNERLNNDPIIMLLRSRCLRQARGEALFNQSDQLSQDPKRSIDTEVIPE